MKGSDKIVVEKFKLDLTKFLCRLFKLYKNF